MDIIIIVAMKAKVIMIVSKLLCFLFKNLFPHLL
jgi:hypothetical protein